ncbi:DUF6037 family protein [Macrococcus bovicus]|uniref:DUF6037 family protein n=1 Tax=Macrococcus bovicus TaxID=69968 RepID=UPI0025A65031|nr:DUF6037 family protein [Macrococcus bovicus]WJP96720.1 DUF6037 family protein [Macrococcus bovicus]
MSDFSKTLKKLYIDMKKHDYDVESFSFTYNNIECDCLFSIDSQPFEITFIKMYSGDLITVPIKNGFIFDLYSNKKTSAEFRKFFNIGFTRGSFDLTTFLNYFSRIIPSSVTERTLHKVSVIDKKYDLHNGEGLYFGGTLNWPKINARKPPDAKHRHRRPENLEKTKKLYPQIYKKYKYKDISVCFVSKLEDAKPFNPEDPD